MGGGLKIKKNKPYLLSVMVQFINKIFLKFPLICPPLSMTELEYIALLLTAL